MIRHNIKKLYLFSKQINTIIHYRKKVRNIIKQQGTKSSKFEEYKKAKRIWSSTISFFDSSWHKIYMSSNGISDYKYCPEDIFYTYIEPMLNNKKMVTAYSDKNLLSKLFDTDTPKTLLRCINGKLYDSNYNFIKSTNNLIPQGEYIIKPSLEHGGGVGVEKLIVENNNNFMINDTTLDLLQIKDIYFDNFIVQEILEQSSLLSQINPSSINTLRITTLRLDREIFNLSSVLRFGIGDSIVDNQRSGGASVGIDENGLLKEFSFNKYGTKTTEHPISSFVFKGREIPSFNEASNLVCKLHSKLHYFDMVSWDIAIDKDNKPIIIEINVSGQEINFHQFNNGPLFGHYTEKIISMLHSKKVS